VALAETLPLDKHLQALGSMGSACFNHAEDLYDHGLNLLVRQLGADRAMVAAQTVRGLEGLWCAGGEGDGLGGAPLALDPNLNFCPQVMLEPASTLVIADAGADPAWVEHSAWRDLGVRSYVGAPLRVSGRTLGVLSVQSEAAHAWQAPEVALVNVMAALFATTMEVEALKIELARAKEMLDLTAAVMEDHALESPGTGLPTRRYLDVWCKTNLSEARRRREVIALATWIQPPMPDRDRRLAQLAGSLRGMDLVVDLGRGRFLLVLPRTLRAGAELVLDRLRSTLGVRELGATLWNPLLGPDREALTLQPAIRRAQLADPGSLERCARGADDGGVVWTLLEPTRENLLGESNPW
jgi:GGDEF domain-containing protein